MASITREAGGRRRIQFIGPDGKRRAIRLGKVNQRSAELVRTRLECLVAAGITGAAVDDETSRWLAGLDQVMTDKLAAAGLVSRRLSVTVGSFLAEYVAGRIDVKPATKEVWSQVQRNLLGYFGADRPLRGITAGDAEGFRLYLVGEKLASTTVHKRLQFARQFFRMACRHKLIDENPFSEVRSQSGTNSDRQRFVTLAETAKLLEACPSRDWRLIVALARYGGLRCPSEVLSLRWQDIDWERDRVRVTSPKTERFVGKDYADDSPLPRVTPDLWKRLSRRRPRGRFTWSMSATAGRLWGRTAGGTATSGPPLRRSSGGRA